ncbi:MAG: TRAP transporter substrate-binding protein DctP [Myxococcales bacterium]|nr:TRAP transporter substrate-binding protein DctP [Myxococcales bacterium]
MHSIRLYALLLASVLLVAAPCEARARRRLRADKAAAKSAKQTLTIATLLPSGTSWMRLFRQFARRVRERTGGTLRIRYYPGGVMGDERDMIAKLKRGRIDGGALTGMGLGQLAGAVRAFELPFFFERAETLYAVRKQLEPQLRAALRKGGVELLAWGDIGWIHFFSRRPMVTRDDILKLRTWAWGDDELAIALVRKLGVKYRPLAVHGVLPALQSGIIDTVYGSFYTTLSLQWYTQVRYATAPHVTFAQAAMVVSNAAFKRLSAAQQRVLMRESRWLEREHVRRLARDNRAARRTLRKQGLIIQEAKPDLVRYLRKRSRDVWREMAGKVFDASWLKRVGAARDAIRARQRQSAGRH